MQEQALTIMKKFILSVYVCLVFLILGCIDPVEETITEVSPEELAGLVFRVERTYQFGNDAGIDTVDLVFDCEPPSVIPFNIYTSNLLRSGVFNHAFTTGNAIVYEFTFTGTGSFNWDFTRNTVIGEYRVLDLDRRDCERCVIADVKFRSIIE